MTRSSLIIVAIAALAIAGCTQKKEAPASTTTANQPARAPETPAPETPAPGTQPKTTASWSEAVKSPDVQTRAAALAVTPVRARIPGELLGALGDAHPEIRRGALRGILGFVLAFSDTTALGRLLKLAESDADPSVRLEAVTALGSLLHRDVLPRLIARYPGEKHLAVRQAILGAVAAAGDRRAGPFLRSLLSRPGEVSMALEGLRYIETQATPALLGLAERGSSGVRTLAIEVLGEIGDAEAAPLLERLLGDADANVVRSAVVSLARLGRAPAASTVIKLIHHAAAPVRAAVVESLASWHRSSAGMAEAVLPALTKQLANDSDATVRVAAANAIGRLGLSAGMGALKQAAGTANPSAVRSTALLALAEIDNGKVLPLLRSAIADRDADVRTAAASALGTLRAQGGVAARVVIGALQKGESNLDARAQMLRSLGRLQARDAVGLIEAMAQNDPVPVMRIEAAKALIALKSPKGLEALRKLLLESPHWQERREAAHALESRSWRERREDAETPWGQRFAAATSTLTLAALAKEQEPQVREVLYLQLGRLRGPAAEKAQRQALSERIPFFRLMAAAGLCRAGDEAGCKILIDSLSAPQSPVRFEAARRVGWYRVGRARADLAKRVGDPVVAVARAATAALSRIEK